LVIIEGELIKLTNDRSHQDASIKFTKKDIQEIISAVFANNPSLKEELKEMVDDELLNDDITKLMAKSSIQDQIFSDANIIR